MRGPSHRGFTLIELLVAITLLAIIAMLSWRGLDSLIRGRDSVLVADAQLRALSRTLSQFERDCAALADPFTTRRPTVVLRQHNLTLVRDWLEPGQPTRWQVVRYSLREGNLVRQTSAPLADSAQLTAALAADAPEATSIVLIPGVAALMARAWIDASGWHVNDTAIENALRPPPSPPGRPPAMPAIRALELSLDTQTQGGSAQRYNKICLTGR
jgi:general secretion pathway protein J